MKKTKFVIMNQVIIALIVLLIVASVLILFFAEMANINKAYPIAALVTAGVLGLAYAIRNIQNAVIEKMQKEIEACHKKAYEEYRKKEEERIQKATKEYRKKENERIRKEKVEKGMEKLEKIPPIVDEIEGKMTFLRGDTLKELKNQLKALYEEMKKIHKDLCYNPDPFETAFSSDVMCENHPLTVRIKRDMDEIDKLIRKENSEKITPILEQIESQMTLLIENAKEIQNQFKALELEQDDVEGELWYRIERDKSEIARLIDEH